MTAPQLIQQIEALGGTLALKGDRIAYDIPKVASGLVEGSHRFSTRSGVSCLRRWIELLETQRSGNPFAARQENRGSEDRTCGCRNRKQRNAKQRGAVGRSLSAGRSESELEALSKDAQRFAVSDPELR